MNDNEIIQTVCSAGGGAMIAYACVMTFESRLLSITATVVLIALWFLVLGMAAT